MAGDRDRLLAKKAKIEAQLAELAKADARRRERDDQRRAMLAGRIVLAEAARDEEFGRRVMRLLDQAPLSPRDRALFALDKDGAGEADESSPALGQGQSPEAEALAAG